MPKAARLPIACACAFLLALCGAQSPAHAQGARAPFTLAQVRSYPFPSELVAATAAPRVAWVFNEQGHRNIWAAAAPQYAPRSLTHFDKDDGQELSSVGLSADGRMVAFVRGGDHDANWDGEVPVNPASSPVPQRVLLWVVPFEGGAPRIIGDGDHPALSPRGDRVAYEHERQIWIAPTDGSVAPRRLFASRGELHEATWSPDGTRLAFVADRGDHSYVGVYENDSTPIVWMAPSTARDASPRWSANGKRLAFWRRPGIGGPPESTLHRPPQPWSVWTADSWTGVGREAWRAPLTVRGSPPTIDGGVNLNYGAGGRLVFESYQDGWPHLYSVSENGGDALLLTPGEYMIETVRMSPDRRFVVASANAGGGADDIDRRHVVKIPIDHAAPEVMTHGDGLEFAPVVTSDMATIVMLSATAQRPPLPAVQPFNGGSVRVVASDRMPKEFPEEALVVPRSVTIRSSDGTLVRAQLFERVGGPAKKPALVFAHGGPARQMLLGWHYSEYYAGTYAMNQYLASRGFVVLSVNYRLGIGYGFDFHQPPDSYYRGANERLDVIAGGEYLKSLPQVDAARVGIFGGSYGGFLTAMSLARSPEVFAAGVDMYGVHDFTADNAQRIGGLAWKYEKGDRAEAADVAWLSSPDAYVAGWRAPVLFIHGDDDRSVRFYHTTDLERRLTLRGIPFEELVIPDDTHHWLRHANALRAWGGAAEFLERKLGLTIEPGRPR